MTSKGRRKATTASRKGKADKAVKAVKIAEPVKEGETTGTVVTSDPVAPEEPVKPIDQLPEKWWAETGFTPGPVSRILREMSTLLHRAVQYGIDGLLWMPEFVHRAWWLTEQIGEGGITKREGEKIKRDWLSLKRDTALYIARFCTDELPVLDGAIDLDDENDQAYLAACSEQIPTMSGEIQNGLGEFVAEDGGGSLRHLGGAEIS